MASIYFCPTYTVLHTDYNNHLTSAVSFMCAVPRKDKARW